ncbi:putative 2OG-Fe(II) oxygenase [Rheinheimera soli]|uniref:Tetratricopeptide (TPR) repeat protein n=1 Tax=Rheinheimera soli TaxID=443616 RepID=A0ABU1W1T1_9GAMM|nr:putative 2OG-Fe(II) oxygenase [Rheinheimera soli]MDR7121897.1 tetratricopeptide (TPR) repeat protein [Rheinheimera soli]
MTRVQLAQQHLQQGRADLAIPLLRQHLELVPDDFIAWKLSGFAWHEEQFEPEAVLAFSKATVLQPADASPLMALAQSQFFSGYSAVDSFYELTSLTPADLHAYRGLALALAADGEQQLAEQLLIQNLAAHPLWLDGHKLLSSMRFTSGDAIHFSDSYQQACTQQPQNLALWLDWFRCYAQLKQWQKCEQVLALAEQCCGKQKQLTLARLFVAAESGDTSKAALLFTETNQIQDPVRAMALVRYQLRQGDVKAAELSALPWLETASAAVFWPYISLIWRLLGDDRAKGLSTEAVPIKAFDVQLSSTELHQLCTVLRSLHKAKAAFAEQSVRGGTQTDQNILLRHEMPLQQLKQKLKAAVQSYVQQLPDTATTDPFLARPRDRALQGRCRFSGSWSTLLKTQGFNVSHTHPSGWISAALHLEIPAAEQLGQAPAGWLQFGAPPAELQLSLDPQLQHQPQAGTLVLFPSTLWHNTVPFESGERLTLAFDIEPQPFSSGAAR